MIHVASLSVDDCDTHMTDSEVLVLDILVQTSSDNDVLARNGRKSISESLYRYMQAQRTQAAWEGCQVP